MEAPPAPLVLESPAQLPLRHRVLFTSGALAAGNATLASVLADPSTAAPRRMVAFVDSGVAAAHPDLGPALRSYLGAHAGMPELALVEQVPGGERCKQSHAVVDQVIRAIDAHRIDRQSYVLAIGGGAVLDAVGYATAIAHRGCRLVRMPTTTLGHDDSGMAVKNGINLGRKKNFIGTFAVPHAVVCDEALLASSPDWSWCGGFSEAVKIALLRDPAFFAAIERDAAAIRARSMDAARPVIRRSAELHYRHIILGGDPFETRSARPLDYGHWLAHRLEGLTDGELPHGQAVAIGVAVDTQYAACAGMLPQADADRVHATLRALGLPLTHALLADLDAVAAGLEEFREHLGGRLTLTLLRGIGDPVDVHAMDAATLRDAVAITSRAS